ncbi:hypothetical protein E2753_20600 [Salmonella enterica]|nr:hypothetical protein [Salmonella enterica]
MQIVHISQDKQPKIAENSDNVIDIAVNRFMNFPENVKADFRSMGAVFMLWRGVHNPDGTVKKIPISAITGLAVDPTDTDHHVTFDDAFIAAMMGPCAGKAWGIGIATGNGVASVDIDHCRKNDGSWSQVAVTVLSRFGDAYREVSQSGNGLHVICRVDELPGGYRNIPGGNPVEMYAENRFIALTGSGCSGSPVIECSEVFASVWDQYKPATKPNTTATQFDWEYDKPLPGYTSTATNQELLSLALSSRSAASVFGNKRSFNLIWSDGSNNSEDDASVIMSLFFYTGGHCQRVENIMRTLWKGRDKWEETRRSPVTDEKISKIRYDIENCRLKWAGDDFYSKSVEVSDTPVAPVTTLDVKTTTGYQYLAGDSLKEYFHSCVFVSALNSVLTPNGEIFGPDAFSSRYGGYQFAISSEATDKPTKNAFQAFTQNQTYRFPKVDRVEYDARKPFAHITESHGVTTVNAFRYQPGERRTGDATPFLTHVAKLIPDASDQKTLLEWMAWNVQNPGQCARWAVVLQGCEGNGKSTIGDVLSRAMGITHTAPLQPSDVGNRFNGWADGKLLAVVNDFSAGDRRDVMETLKPMLTDQMITVQRKGQDQRLVKNHLSFLITTNHRDGVIKTQNDRRYAIFFTAQQCVDDLRREGMNETYFNDLYDWLNNGGDEIVAGYLDNRSVVNFPNRAPQTTSTEEAIMESRSPVEQFVDDFCEFCCDGEISSDQLFVAWKMYSQGAGVNPGSSVGFGRKFNSAIAGKNVTHGFVKGNNRNQRGYTGIRLKNVFQPVPLTVVV